MAQKKRTAAEVAKLDKARAIDKYFESLSRSLQLLDLTKADTRTFQTFSKERLRTFIKNPKSNEAQLIALSQFLYMLSYPYRRLIQYNASMVDLTAYRCIPKIISLNISDMDVEQITNQTFASVTEVRKMQLKLNLFPFLVTAWREDCAFGYIYEDDSGFYLMPLEGAYCKINSVNIDTATYNFAFDFSYFRSHPELLEYWDSEFKSKYDAYKKDTKLQWQELDRNKTFCIKVNSDDLKLKMPPFTALFEQIIDLIDAQSIQKVKDNLSIYKLLVARLRTRSNATTVNAWQTDIDGSIDYYNKLKQKLPPEIDAVISPMDIETIDFKGTTTDEVDMIANSMKNLFVASGASQVLDGSKITGSNAFEAAKIADGEMALILLPQIEAWVNRRMTIILGDNHDRIKFLRITPWTKDSYITKVQTASQYGVPVKLDWAALLGYDVIDVVANQFLEENCLQLSQTWTPLRSSATLSSKDSNGLGSDVDPNQGGRPTKDTSELSDEGDKTRWQDKNDK